MPATLPLMPDVGIVALPYHVWDSVWMTPHHVLPRLSNYFHVVWLDPPRHVRDVVKNPSPSLVAPVHVRPAFHTITPPPWFPDLRRPDWLAHLFHRRRVLGALSRLESLGCTTPLLHLWHPQFEPALAVRNRFALSLYHIDDEYSYRADAPPLGAQEASVLRQVDQVFAISPALMERKGGVNPAMAMVPEGVDSALYERSVAEPADLAGIPHPRIGYTGNLKRQLDWRLLHALAKRHPEWSFVMVGPISFLDDDQQVLLAEMRTLGNVHFLGPKSVVDLAAYPQHFDVSVMPYAVNGYTHNIYPLKLHEYLAGGRPIVATPIRSLLDFSDVIGLGTGVDDWTAAIASALQPAERTAEADERRRAVARGYDWTELVFAIAATIARRLGPEFERRLEKLPCGATPAGARAPAAGAVISTPPRPEPICTEQR